MPTREDFEKMNALIAEAVALCEAAQAEFERVHQEIQSAIMEGRALLHDAPLWLEEQRIRGRLAAARRRLVRRLRNSAKASQ